MTQENMGGSDFDEDVNWKSEDEVSSMKLLVWFVVVGLFLGGLYWTADSLLSGGEDGGDVKVAESEGSPEAQSFSLWGRSEGVELSEAEAAWKKIESLDDPKTFKNYISDFPNSQFRDAAQSRIEELMSLGGVGETADGSMETDRSGSVAADGPSSDDVEDVTEISVERSGAAVVTDRVTEQEVLVSDAQDAVEDEAVGRTDNRPIGAISEYQLSLSIIGRPRLVRDLQSELTRVGCEPGNIDGVWDTGGRDALERFNKETSSGLDAYDPKRRAIQVVQEQKELVCRTVSRVEPSYLPPSGAEDSEAEKRRKKRLRLERKRKKELQRKKRQQAAKKKKKAQKKKNSCRACIREYGSQNPRTAAMCQHVC